MAIPFLCFVNCFKPASSSACFALPASGAGAAAAGAGFGSGARPKMPQLLALEQQLHRALELQRLALAWALHRALELPRLRHRAQGAPPRALQLVAEDKQAAPSPWVA